MVHLDNRILLSAKENEGTEKFLRKSLADVDTLLLDYLTSAYFYLFGLVLFGLKVSGTEDNGIYKKY